MLDTQYSEPGEAYFGIPMGELFRIGDIDAKSIEQLAESRATSQRDKYHPHVVTLLDLLQLVDTTGDGSDQA
jgi:hypothetical protein